MNNYVTVLERRLKSVLDQIVLAEDSSVLVEIPGGVESPPLIATSSRLGSTARLPKAPEKLNDSCLEALRLQLREPVLTSDLLDDVESLLRHAELRRKRIAGHSSRIERMCVVAHCALVLAEAFHRTNDPRYLNAALKLMDAPSLRVFSHLCALRLRKRPTLQVVRVVSAQVSIGGGMRRVSRQDWQPDRPLLSADPNSGSPAKEVSPFPPDARIVVLSPNNYSLYSLSVLQLAEQAQATVVGVAVRTFTARRFKEEFARDGTRLLAKIWRKAVLRRRSYPSDHVFGTLADYCSSIGVRESSVSEWAQGRGVPYWMCGSLNDPDLVKAIAETNPDLVIFTGGGLIREQLLSASRCGVMNMHMGILPWYRGMDVVEWPVLEGYPNRTGYSVHLMVRGLDEGPILSTAHMPAMSMGSVKDLRMLMESFAPSAIVSTARDLLEGDLSPQSQQKEEGRQYFVMHRALRQIVDSRFADYAASRKDG